MSSASPSKEPLYMEVHVSRPVLRALDEPQVLYAMATVQPSQQESEPIPPPLNLSLVLDRSTSMAGERLDTARISAENIITQLRPQDKIAVVTFSDRAEVLLSTELSLPMSEARQRLSLIQANGGTEIYQGLSAGVNQLRQVRHPKSVDHVLLLTDGRTYGDEAACLQLAEEMAQEGIEITAMGIGEEWNDLFLDSLATKTGGQAVYIDNLASLGPFLQQKFQGLGQVHADQVVVEVETTPGVTLHSAFRVNPAPMPLVEGHMLRLGTLFSGNNITLLMEFLIPPITPMDSFEISRLHLGAHLAKRATNLRTILSLSLPVVSEPVPAPIPGTLLAAVRNVNLARLQEKALADAQTGHLNLAKTRLERIATRLFEMGEPDLANTVLSESSQLRRTHAISEKGKKAVKYGTRSLVDPKHGGRPK
ncbi:MAG: VWA domain-containing protein [Anaerolineales bacterium]|nr:VWA domain-containing protein [Anaerolineales bacterium]